MKKSQIAWDDSLVKFCHAEMMMMMTILLGKRQLEDKKLRQNKKAQPNQEVGKAIIVATQHSQEVKFIIMDAIQSI